MFVVSNAGTHPELQHAAAGLIESGRDVAYFTSLGWGADSSVTVIAAKWNRQPWASPISRQILRRTLPQAISASRIRRRAVAMELLATAARHLPQRRSDSLYWKRAQYFDYAVARTLQARGPKVTGALAQYTNALSTFDRIPGNVPKILNYPVAHHGWMQDEMEAEARRCPRWAKYLQGHNYPKRHIDRLNKEIESADYILLASSFARMTFISQGVDLAKLVVVPLGAEMVPPPNASPDVRERSESRSRRIVFAGQITQRKGVGYLLDALSDPRLSHVSAEFVGPSFNGMHNELLRFHRVNYIPPVPRATLRSIVSRADLLVLPSLAEGFGLVALEAMATGVPAIVTDRTFGSDIISAGVNGWIAPAADSAALAQLIFEVLGDPNILRRVADSAIESAKNYTWKKYEQRVANALLELVE